MMIPSSTTALTYVAAQRASLREWPVDLDLPSRCAGDEIAFVRTRHSALSRGTERLVFHNQIPSSERDRMRGPLQLGEFPFPVAYGYAAVGVVERGPVPLVGKTVFCLAPHIDGFQVATRWLNPLPDGLPAHRATLAANMETALNGMWDGGVGPCDRVVVVGAGVLGLLLTGLLASMPGVDPVVVDVRQDRRPAVEALGGAMLTTAEFAADACKHQAFDVAFHTSATGAGLKTALSALAMEGTLVELSWYGDSTPEIPLGSAFHALRLKIVSSQVGSVAPSRRARWSHADRMRAALSLLTDERYDALITRRVTFGDLPEQLPSILAPDADGLATVVDYPVV